MSDNSASKAENITNNNENKQTEAQKDVLLKDLDQSDPQCLFKMFLLCLHLTIKSKYIYILLILNIHSEYSISSVNIYFDKSMVICNFYSGKIFTILWSILFDCFFNCWYANLVFYNDHLSC